MVIRKLRPGDYDALIALWKVAKLPYKRCGRDNRESIVRQLKLHNSIYLVAELDGKLVGSVLGTHDGRKGWINRLAVLPAYRRRGIARRLVTEVERRLHKIGIDIVACQIEDWNKVSMKIFKKLGYKPHPDIIYFTKRRYAGV